MASLPQQNKHLTHKKQPTETTTNRTLTATESQTYKTDSITGHAGRRGEVLVQIFTLDSFNV